MKIVYSYNTINYLNQQINDDVIVFIFLKYCFWKLNVLNIKTIFWTIYYLSNIFLLVETNLNI